MGYGKYMRSTGGGGWDLIIQFFILPVLACWMLWVFVRDMVGVCAWVWHKCSRSPQENDNDAD